MPTSTKSRRPAKKTTTAKKTTARKKVAPVKKRAPAKVGLRMSEQERCATVGRTLQRAFRRHPKLKGVRVVAKAARLSFFEVPEENVDVFATILERMWPKIRRYVE